VCCSFNYKMDTRQSGKVNFNDVEIDLESIFSKYEFPRIASEDKHLISDNNEFNIERVGGHFRLRAQNPQARIIFDKRLLSSLDEYDDENNTEWAHLCDTNYELENESERYYDIPPGLAQEWFGNAIMFQDHWEGEPLTPGDFKGKLFTENPNQELIVSTIVKQMTDYGQCYNMLESPTGSGKTIMATAIIHRLGLKALWVCTTTVLLDQAKKQGFNTFCPHLKVGQLKGNKYKQVEDCDIVLTTPRTLARKQGHDLNFLKKFGIVCFDEAHKSGIKDMFVHASPLLQCKYRLGVSATMRRNDALFEIVPAMFGTIGVKLSRVWDHVDYVAHYLRYPSMNKQTEEFPLSQIRFKGQKRTDFNKYKAQITRHEQRSKTICRQIYEDLNDLKRSKVYVFSEYVDHLKQMSELLMDMYNIPSGVIWQETNKGDKLDKNMNHDVIFVTYGSGVDGVNDLRIDTIYYTTPFSKSSNLRIEQSIGRCRPGVNKFYPLIRDWIDNCHLGYSMQKARLKELKEFNPVQRSIVVKI
jgi:superfamily II DNA or RNA helicase